MNCPNCKNDLRFMKLYEGESTDPEPCPYCGTDLWFKVTGSDREMGLWNTPVDNYLNVVVDYENFKTYFWDALEHNHKSEDGVIKFGNYILPYTK